MERLKFWLQFQALVQGFPLLFGYMNAPWLIFWLIWGTVTACHGSHSRITGSTRY